MKKMHLIILFAILFAPNCMGQYGVAQAWGTDRGLHGTTQALTNNNFIENLSSTMGAKFGFKGVGGNLAEGDIEGTIYLNENFILGTLYVNDKEVKKMYMRYDAYNDEIELKDALNSEEIKAMVKHPVYSCSLDGDEYYYLGYTNEVGGEKKGYLVPIVIGDAYTLFIKYQKVYKKGKQASTPLDASFPPRFLDKAEYYVSVNNESPFFMKTKKSEVISIFPKQDQSAIKKYIKEKRLKAGDHNDLRNLFTYANTL
ncbi:MAG: hypothetical protein RIM83_07340 [Allomuricauda sp.]